MDAPAAPHPSPPLLDWTVLAPSLTTAACLSVAAAAAMASAWPLAVAAVAAALVLPPLARLAAVWAALSWLPGPTPINWKERVLG